MSVVVTGLGQVSAAGDSLGTFWEAVSSPVAAQERLSLREPSVLAVRRVADVRVDPGVHLGKKGLRQLDPSTQLALVAARLALESARCEAGAHAPRLGVVFGGMQGAMTAMAQFDRDLLTGDPLYANPGIVPFIAGNMPGANVAIRFGAGGPNLTVNQGASSGLEAVALARRLIEHGQADAVLAGGVDAVAFESLRALHAAGIVPDDGPGLVGVPYHPESRGAIAGGGAAVLLLEREELARARGAPVLATVEGQGSALGTTPQALEEACRAALDEAGTRAGDLGWVCGGANGVARLDRSELEALEALLRSTEVPVCSIKGAVGECLSAGGALSAVAAVLGLGVGRTPVVTGLEAPPAERLCVSSAVRSGKVLCVAASWEGPVSAVLFGRGQA